MVTIKKIDQLLDIKLAKLENITVKSLTNPSDRTLDVTRPITNIVIEEHNSATSDRPFPPVKSFHDECTNLQIKQVHDLHYNIV